MRRSEHPPAPQCTHWCKDPHDGWDESVGGVQKTCRRVIPVEGFDWTGDVVLTRFADLTADGIEVDDPVIRVETECEQMSLPAAVLLAETLVRAVELVAEPVAA